MFDSSRKYIDSIRRRDPAARTLLEILFAYPGIHAMALHRVTHVLWRWRLHWVARMLSQLGRWLTGIEIHPGATIGKRFFIDHGMGVVIGETAEIGDDCTLYHGVTLGGTSWKKEKRHPTLENDVVIGAGAKVLGPITLGEGARVGSNSVVVKDVPAGATVVGIPGRVVVATADDGNNARRKAMAEKIGFDAYGQTADMPDPVANAVDCLLDHMHSVDEKLEQMCATLKKSGIDVSILDLPELPIDHLKDD
ncbi:MAG: serine O-acetyltransferase [Proteobacteria bacterium]|nr:serine O-acetyltransferase [Pseudomonadota bacterium]